MITVFNYPYDASGKMESFRYPSGESQVRLTQKGIDAIRDSTKIVVEFNYVNDSEIIGLIQLTDAIDHMNHGATKILVIPYLPYARADRRFVQGDCFGLKVFASLINDLYYDEVYTLDVHSEESTHLFENLFNVAPYPFIDQALHLIGSPANTAIILPDAGASRYDIGGIQCSKIRDAGTGKLSGFEVPPVENFKGFKSALIIDDICDGGGTFLGIADKMADYNLDLYLYVSHGIFSKGATELAKRFKRIFTTDSIYGNQAISRENVTILPCGGEIRKEFLTLPEIWQLGAS